MVNHLQLDLSVHCYWMNFELEPDCIYNRFNWCSQIRQRKLWSQ